MEKFELAVEAMREVKKLANEINVYEKIYFVYSDYCEKYFVSDDSDEIEEMIHQRWVDSGCDCNPENEAESYEIWQYSHAVNKTQYPNLYAHAKKSLISSVPLIRKKQEIECDYSVSFIISNY